MSKRSANCCEAGAIIDDATGLMNVNKDTMRVIPHFHLGSNYEQVRLAVVSHVPLAFDLRLQHELTNLCLCQANLGVFQ